MNMRQDLKNKLDALERNGQLRRLMKVAVIVLAIAGAAFLYSRPSRLVESVPATVEVSEFGVSTFGRKIHNLWVRLDDEKLVRVNAIMIQTPLKSGQHVTLRRYKGFWGNNFYRLDPENLKLPPQNR